MKIKVLGPGNPGGGRVRFRDFFLQRQMISGKAHEWSFQPDGSPWENVNLQKSLEILDRWPRQLEEVSDRQMVNSVITSPLRDTTGGPINDGGAYVFRWTGTSWAEEAILEPPISPTGHGVRSVDIDGDTVVVGAPFSSGAGGTALFGHGESRSSPAMLKCRHQHGHSSKKDHHLIPMLR